jgi:hypothetical protein
MPVTVYRRPTLRALTEEAKATCRRLGIARYLPVIMRIVEECFPRITHLRTYPEVDPETGEEWLVILIRVRGSAKQVREWYDCYTARKCEALPAKHVAAISLVPVRQ